MSNSIILDTHVLLWILLKPDELSVKIKENVALMQEKRELFISSISLWEIAMLYSKKRINIYEPIRDFLTSIANINGLLILDITPEVAAESVMLSQEFHGDPADRIIIATTKILGSTLLTRDQKIIDYAKFHNIKILEA